MTAQTPQEALARRIRRVLAGRQTREVSMFGGLSFMVDESLAVAARRDGSLLVRVDPAERDEVMQRPGAGPALMKSGRAMGDGWLAVAPDAVVDDDAVGFWVDVGLAARPQ
ncbi:TfoX/Sxy family protein [Aeromicrobium sp. Marseille-Q0843]|uniref:TfoX/Sxy family protein n=1 Tax=Aeromicrobium phoceense TaxID=2754045 RepID=A0A838XMF4_9ACTN|nr:TfoX/Sxy family protein [Aeromicrobium phoceense]MBA4609816.1 TfoX/Sxy family protein [Aeromicrobium phoceense]